MAVIRIGISGWRYTPWRGVFYPQGSAAESELWYASRVLPTLEINGSFYSLQRPEYYAQWREETPEHFVFAVKGPRYITHMKKLRDVEAPLANFFASGLFNLREKLGPDPVAVPAELRLQTRQAWRPSSICCRTILRPRRHSPDGGVTSAC